MSTRRFVAINQTEDGAMFYLGIFDDYRTAVGEIMSRVWELKDSYRDEGDIFEYSELEEMEGEGGEVMTVEFRDANWDKPTMEYYHILYADD